jgi:hypothetical protein
MFDIESIAHALSNKCRFSGHSRKFWSVAQHSVLVSCYCDLEDAKWGLLHDASEAYLVDLPTPLKILPEFSFYKEIEDKLQEVVYKTFGLIGPEPPSIYRADKILLVSEKRDLMPENDGWKISDIFPPEKFPPLPFTLCPLEPEQSEKFFLNRFKDLFGP